MHKFIFKQSAKTTITSGNPGTGHIIWNNATQASATQINVNHIDQNGDDIDIFLALLTQGQIITIQDQAISANYQKWQITGTPVYVSPTYWEYPVTLITSTHSFSNNDQVLLAIISPSGTSGTSGSSGTSGVDGTSGTSGTSGISIVGPTGPTGPGGGGGSSAIRLTNQTLATGGWGYTGGYYQYTYSDANITTSTTVDFTPYNDYNFTAVSARVLPYIQSGSGSCILYSQYSPSGQIIGDVIITTVS